MATLLTGAPKISLTETVIGASGTASTYYGAAVFGAQRGLTEPYLTTSYASWLSNYGNPNTDWSFAGLCLKGFLTDGPGVWNLRVVEEAYYASTFLVLDTKNTTDQVSTCDNYIPTINTVYIADSHMFPTGSSAGVTSGFVLRPKNVSGSLPSANVALTLSVSGAVNTTAKVSTTLNNTSDVADWLSTLSQAVIEAAESVGVDISFYTLASGHIFMFCEEGYNISLTSADNVEAFNAPFIQVFARDPGATYANNYYGAGLSSFSTGLAQISQIKVSDSIASSVSLTYGTETGIVEFAAADNVSDFIFNAISTLTTFASGDDLPIIFGATDNAGNVVTKGSANASSATIITATATQAGRALFTIKSNSVNMSVASKVSGLDDPNTFKFNVYSKSNLTTPLETFTVSLQDQMDANNVQQYIEDVVNGGNGLSGSSYVRAFVGNGSSTFQLSYNGLDTPTYSGNISWLSGGDDGNKPSNATIIAGWESLTDTESYKINYLINCGYTDPSVQEAMATLADTRKDCEAILDLPQNITNSADAYNYRFNTLNIYTSRAGCYTPFIKVLNPTTSRYVWCPPSGHVASQFAYTKNNYGVYEAPAGSKRGGIKAATDVYVNYHDSGDLDVLDSAQLNVIRRIAGEIQIDNDRTMINNNGPLSSMNVRMMVTDIETYAISVATSEKFELDNSSLATTLEKTIENYIEPYKAAGAIADYAVICDDSNNGPVYLDNAQRNISIFLIPVRATRYFLIGVGIGTNAVGLAELEASGLS